MGGAGQLGVRRTDRDVQGGVRVAEGRGHLEGPQEASEGLNELAWRISKR